MSATFFPVVPTSIPRELHGTLKGVPVFAGLLATNHYFPYVLQIGVAASIGSLKTCVEHRPRGVELRLGIAHKKKQTSSADSGLECSEVNYVSSRDRLRSGVSDNLAGWLPARR
jgi:hypothetical protein